MQFNIPGVSDSLKKRETHTTDFGKLGAFGKLNLIFIVLLLCIGDKGKK